MANFASGVKGTHTFDLFHKQSSGRKHPASYWQNDLHIRSGDLGQKSKQKIGHVHECEIPRTKNGKNLGSIEIFGGKICIFSKFLILKESLANFI